MAENVREGDKDDGILGFIVFRSSYNDLKKRYKESEAKNKSLQTTCDNTLHVLKDMDDKHKQAITELRDLKQAMSLAKEQMLEEKTKFEKQEESLKEETSKLSELQEEHEEVKKRIQTLNEHLQAEETKLKTANAKHRKDVAELREKLNKAMDQMDTKQVKELSVSQTKSEETDRRYTETIQQMKGQMHTMEEEILLLRDENYNLLIGLEKERKLKVENDEHTQNQERKLETLRLEHSKELQMLRKNMEKQQEDLQRGFELQKKAQSDEAQNIAEEYKQKCKDAEKRFKIESEWSKKYDEMVQSTESEHTRLHREYQIEILSLKEKIDEIQHTNEMEARAVRAEHEAEKETIKEQLLKEMKQQCEMLQTTFEKDRDKVIGEKNEIMFEREKDMEVHMGKLRKYEDQIKSLKDNIEKTRKGHERELIRVKTRMEEEIQRTKRDLKGQIQSKEDANNEIEKHYKQKIQEIQEEMRRERGVMQRNSADTQKQELLKELEKMKEKHNLQMQKIRDETARERQNLEKLQKQQLQAMTKEISNIQKHYENQIKFMRDEMQEENRLMEEKQQAVIQTGDLMLKDRDQQIAELMDILRKAKMFAFLSEFQQRFAQKSDQTQRPCQESE